MPEWDVSRTTQLLGPGSSAPTSVPQEQKTWGNFNGDLNKWDVGQVTKMQMTFFEAQHFNSPLDHWDTSRVTHMFADFHGADAFNQPIGDWDVSEVTFMDQTFTSSAYNQELKHWNVAKVTEMTSVFSFDASFNLDIDTWNVAQVTDMSGIFQQNYIFDQSIESWNAQQVISGGFAFSFYNRENQNPPLTYPKPCWLPGFTCTTTSTTTTHTTVKDCEPGEFVNGSNLCESCPNGQYRTDESGHVHEALTGCRPHSSCGPGEIVLFEGSAEVDVQCAVPSATSHCGANEFTNGLISEYQGQWHLQCVAHTNAGSLNVSLCPWANSTHPRKDNTLSGINISNGETHNASNMTSEQTALFSSIDELIRAADAKGHVWVRLCTPKRTCLDYLNEYVITDGSDSSNRVCGVCPRICGGVEYAQPNECPQQNVPTGPLPRTECTVSNGNNSNVCCRIEYDRDAYQQNLVDGDCESDPFGGTNASNHLMRHQCTGLVALRSTISTTTTTTSTTTRTDTSVTTSTTHLIMCNPGEFRNVLTNVCENCPDGQFQPSVNFVGTSCRPHSVCDPETEIELTAVDVIDARKHDTLCGTLQECPNGQYRVNHDDGTVQSGSWKIDCRTLEALSGANACDQHPGSDLNITIFQNETTGGLIVQHDVEALRNVPLIHICSFWTDCLASENQYIASDASTSSDRVCQQCPYLESGTEVQFDWIQHSCNMREADDGSYSTSAGYHGECMGVTRDNAHYCCRRGFDRKLFHFRETTAEDCRIHALNEDDVGISHAWLANSILVPNPTTATTTTVTESKLTSTSTTPPETIDVSGDTVKIVAAGTSSTEEEAAGFAALGIGVAVIIGVCAVGIYQARKSSFSDRKLFHEERRKILFHVE